ncbi:MAG: 3'-5' exonuclease [Elusimicrobiales bacterium]
MKESILKMNECTLIDNARFIIVDVETTGLDPNKDRICEIAYIEMIGIKNDVKSFSTLVNPAIDIPSNITEICGISNDDVKNAPFFKDIAAKIIGDFYNSILVGHNILFDFSFIDSEIKRLGLKFPCVKLVDTVTLSKRFQPFTHTPNHKLKNIARSINLISDNWHRAANDVEITKQIFTYFMTKLIKDYGIKTVDELIRIAKPFQRGSNNENPSAL